MLKADKGRLPVAEATQLVNAAKQAIANVTPKAAATPQAKDVVSDALVALQTALDTLHKAVTSGDAGQFATAVTGVAKALVNCLAATLLAGGLPAPTLPASTVPGLPTLPSLPAPAPLLPAT